MHRAEQALEVEPEAELRDGREDRARAPRLPKRTTVIGMSRSVRGTDTAPPAAAAGVARRSRRPATIEPKISGSARHMLMMPPAATAPAPM